MSEEKIVCMLLKGNMAETRHPNVRVNGVCVSM